MAFSQKIYFLLIPFLLKISILLAESGDSWAYKTLQTMSMDEKIGQLFMIAGYVDADFAQKEIDNGNIIEEIDHYITDYHVGGIAFVGPSESIKQVNLTNHYQEISKYPILIAQDLEWGLAMRLKDGMQFPKNITLGAVNDNDLIYKIGKEIGVQAKLIGVHMNLSPVLDVNIDPENIAINVRSFGSSPQNVAVAGIAMIHGLQDAGIIASAKHFPGLGDITIDPHLSLPCNRHEKQRLRDVELYPFVQAIEAGVLSIQTEHLIVPALESDPHIPSSLSSKIVDDLLKKEMGFKGLVLSGALRMKALTKNFSEEHIVLNAFLAGNDMLLMPHNFPKAYQTLRTALNEGKIQEKDIDERVLKILQIKEIAKLHCQCIIPIPSQAQLHSAYAKELKKEAYQKGVSLLRSNEHFRSFSSVDKSSIAYVQLGESSGGIFEDQFNDCYIFNNPGENAAKEQQLIQSLDKYSTIILAVYPADPRRIVEIRFLNEKLQEEELKHFHVHGISEPFAKLIDKLKKYQEKTIVAFFGNPFGLHFFNDYTTFIMAYENDLEAQKAVLRIMQKITTTEPTERTEKDFRHGTL